MKRHAYVVDTSKSPHARLRPVALNGVTITDQFWAPRIHINAHVTLPSQYTHCEETGRIANFRRAAGREAGDFEGLFFNDSDVYKWLEAVGW
ncbi:MAG: beta-L-arabinofuranosidase domain-containing protein, partial [Roseiflexaceae bacterium]